MRLVFFFILLLSQTVFSASLNDHCEIKAPVKKKQVYINYLDCLSISVPLTRLGAAWLLIKKANRSFDDVKEFSHLESENDLGKSLKNLEEHLLKIAFKDYKRIKKAININTLYVAKEKPLRKYHLYQKKNIVKKIGSKIRTRFKGYQHTISDLRADYTWFESLDHNDLLKGRDFDELWNYYKELRPCHSDCTERMYSKVIRGLFVTLGHKDLVKAFINFRKGQASVSPSESLTYGCFPSDGNKFQRTLLRKVKYLDGRSLLKTNRESMLGLPMYFDALYKDKLDKLNYTGMNGILRNISESAYQDLQELQSFGIAKPAYYERSEDFNLGEFKQGVSQYLIEYWEARNEHLLSKEEAAKKFLDRPFFNETFFEPIPLDTGLSAIFKLNTEVNLRKWIEKLYEINSQTPYQLLGYDFFNVSQFREIIFAIKRQLPSIDEVSIHKIPKRKKARSRATRYEFNEVIHAVF